MDSIAIHNLRSLKDTGDITLKPINILVGTNSSGKSTLLRVFPLLRQSVERKTMGPILWNGEYTDFGSFETSLCRYSREATERLEEDNHISFDFEFSIPKETYTPYRRKGREDQAKTKIKASIKIKKGHFTDSSYTSEYKIIINKNKVVFELDEMGVIGRISSPTLYWELRKQEIKYQRTIKDTLLPVFININLDNPYTFFSEKGQIADALLKQIKRKLTEYSGSSSESKTHDIAKNLTRKLETPPERLVRIKAISSTMKFRQKTQNWDISNREFIFLSALIDWYFIVNNSFVINNEITKTLKNIHYIAPLRASTERYYRYQDLGVDEIDHKGSNLAMFIRNIYHIDRISLNDWTKENFDFVIENSDDSDSHLSIKISRGDGYSYNISDMGFGYSQILPIIVQLWAISSGYELRMKNNGVQDNELTSVIVAIEQPELHLHPKMQADIAIVLSKAIKLAKENNIDLKLIIETHSQTLISKLGDMICSGDEIKSNDVNIILFEQDNKKPLTKISYSSFNTDGVLKNWPYGFFNY
ncbi:AAA family ATPase [Pectobacterium brasiliense]|uniref:AAA family ATPase n=1 Tax=Pectobacterium brasiliense TaxID=180957 RepID=UPI000C1C1A46|nr:AAA family ATPase [Pectobacterium brasiliense]ATV45823.1 hypothetical protein CTV95_21465 [Pectobacterium brasiliense]MCA6981397.1 AAA family ATPase [Pectobacterium brasiliense]MCH4990959.1 AAA family ATPase [Pectobacterium brasiliense]